MIGEFLDAWQLFAASWISAWLLAPLLGLVGVAMVARGAIFQGVATAQASTAAIALMLVLAQAAPWCGSPLVIASVAMLVAMACAILAVSGRGSEAMNGWLFLASCAATPLLLIHSPHGMADVQRLITSSLIGATWWDVGMFSLLLTLVMAGTAHHGAAIRLVLTDPEFASDVGVHTGRWQMLIGVIVGLVIGVGLGVAGLLFVAGCLLLPALAAVALARTVTATLWMAPAIALVAALLGTVVSHRMDLPLGQVVVAVLALIVAMLNLLRRLVR